MSAADDLLAWDGWRWIPRMLNTEGWTCMCADDDGRPLLWADDGGGWVEEFELPDGDARPDLDDAGTLGCIEHGLLRDAWGPDAVITVHRWPNGEGFIEIRIGLDMVHARCAEPFADVLVRACLAAPFRGES